MQNQKTLSDIYKYQIHVKFVWMRLVSMNKYQISFDLMSLSTACHRIHVIMLQATQTRSKGKKKIKSWDRMNYRLTEGARVRRKLIVWIGW
jgi:hypothetical protein